MEPTRPMGSLIGFDDHPAAGALNRGRRSTDPGNQRFAEVFDLAAYAASGDRDVARITDARPTSPLTHVAPESNARSLSVASPSATVDPAIEAAADRLFLHLTTGWTPDATGTTRAPVIMRLQDAEGTHLASRVVPAPHDDGPEVA
ncbi:MAG: hypothetical protein AAGC46_11960 [Solirubrobacteraceae bacterium]|nr:hypothetical protein [Patulibacter sp.]